MTNDKTLTILSPPDSQLADYLLRLARFFLGLGVNGSGGLFSIRRISSSVRRFATSGGSRSNSSDFGVFVFGVVAIGCLNLFYGVQQ